MISLGQQEEKKTGKNAPLFRGIGGQQLDQERNPKTVVNTQDSGGNREDDDAKTSNKKKPLMV